MDEQRDALKSLVGHNLNHSFLRRLRDRQRSTIEKMRDFESWEDQCHFHDQRDYAGLVAYSKNEVKRSPNDLYAAER